jgi:hypothetical protein
MFVLFTFEHIHQRMYIGQVEWGEMAFAKTSR